MTKAKRGVTSGTSADIRRVSRVAFDGKKVSIGYDKPNGSSREVVQFACEDQPSAEFKAAQLALKPFAIEALELRGAKSWETAAEVRSVSVSRTRGGDRSFVLTLVCPLEAGGASTNTPLRHEKAEVGVEGAAFASEAFVAAVAAFCAEALVYVDGQRTQKELFPPKGEGEEEPEAATG